MHGNHSEKRWCYPGLIIDYLNIMFHRKRSWDYPGKSVKCTLTQRCCSIRPGLLMQKEKHTGQCWHSSFLLSAAISGVQASMSWFLVKNTYDCEKYGNGLISHTALQADLWEAMERVSHHRLGKDSDWLANIERVQLWPSRDWTLKSHCPLNKKSWHYSGAWNIINYKKKPTCHQMPQQSLK